MFTLIGIAYLIHLHCEKARQDRWAMEDRSFHEILWRNECSRWRSKYQYVVNDMRIMKMHWEFASFNRWADGFIADMKAKGF